MPRRPIPCPTCGGQMSPDSARCRDCRGHAQTAKCGTYGGWARHKSRGEPQCEPCIKAQRDYHSRRRALGLKKRWTSQRFDITCIHCRESARVTTPNGKYCSAACASKANGLKRRRPRVVLSLDEQRAQRRTAQQHRRTAIRAAYEDGDSETFFCALVAQADTETCSCWVWPRLDRQGYPKVNNMPALHRAVLEMKHGAPLGSQHAHHVCANRACVNPDHLQPVTYRENTAEMLARQSYLARIRELEAALAAVDPTHPLLRVITVA